MSQLAGRSRQTCPACNGLLMENASFCPHCGRELAKVAAPLHPEPKQPPPPAIREPEPGVQHIQPFLPLVSPSAPSPSKAATCACGQALAEEARFCQRCGLKVGDTPKVFVLTPLGPGGSQPAIQLDDRDLIIGKAPDCDLAIPDDDYLSRQHARISKSQEMFFVEDLRSSNGTFLRVRRPIVLEAGDEIVVGTTILRFTESSNNGKPMGDAPCQAPCG